MDSSKKTRMYSNTKTWNPFKGCKYDCVYCKVSFQALNKRLDCEQCKSYIPHYHVERLYPEKIPNAEIVFVCGNGDITFCDSSYVYNILDCIKEKNKTHPNITYYLQSKNPACFTKYLNLLPQNVILVTTLETDEDEDYRKISKAPLPSKRYEDFLKLNYPRKVVTIEPIMEFNHYIFLEWIKKIKPEYVWIGYNSRPKLCKLPEPSRNKVEEFITALERNDIQVRRKERLDV